MKSLFRRLYAAFSLAALAFAWPMTFVQAQTPAPVPDYVVILGDSQCRIALSWGAGTNNLAKRINDVGYGTNVLCHGGYALSRLITTIPAELERVKQQRGKNPMAIIVFAPGNGTATAEEARTFTTMLRGYSTNIIWFGPYHSPDATIMRTHQANHNTISTVLPSLGVTYQNNINTDPNLDYKDKAHFTTASYAALATRFFPLIQPHLRGITSPNATNVSATTANGALDDEQGVDAAGRTESQVAEDIAIRCADSNPVFPIHLSIGIGGTTEVNGLTEYINLVYRYMTAIVLVVTIVMVTYGGFKYLMSATPLGVSDGKDIIKNAVIGMTLVLGAYVILNTLNPATTVLQFTKPPEDITCIDFTANFGYQSRPGLTDQQRQDIINSGVGSLISYWDPLLLRARPMIMCNPAGTSAPSGEYLRGLQATFNDIATGSCPSTSTCVEGDEYAEAVSNTDLPDVLEGESNFCSDGSLYSVCSRPEHCKQDQGLICLGDSTALHDEWQVCVKTSNNEEGSPCGWGYPQSGLANRVDVGCAPGLTCTYRQKNYPNDASGVVDMTGLRVCTKQVRTIVNSEIRGLNSGDASSAALICRYHRDCAAEGSRCAADAPGNLKRACVPAEPADGVACGAVFTGGDGSMFPCTENNGFTCAFCPGDGARNWTALKGSSQVMTIGQCKPNASIGQNCAGN